MDTVTLDFSTFSAVAVEDIELETVNEANHKGFYTLGSPIPSFTSLESLKCPVDRSKIVLKNSFGTLDNSFLRFQVMGCDQARLPDG